MKAPVKEAVFQRALMIELRCIPNSFFTVKEAKSLRGLPDIYGCVNGHFVTLEVKRTRAEAERKTGRIVLQRKIIQDIQKAKGYASFIYPENKEHILKELRKFCASS